MEEFINDAEGLIEEECVNAWGTRSISVVDELYDIFADYQEFSFQLRHANIMDFSSPTDKMEIWDGANWIDWIADYTEGRGDDFFVDYELGKIYFRNRRPTSGFNRVKMTYRYNSGSTVPRGVKLATINWVGVILANSEYVSVLFPSGESENVSIESRISRYERQIKKWLGRHKVGISRVSMPFTPL